MVKVVFANMSAGTTSIHELDGVVSSYQSFNLDGRRTGLDEKALLIASAQESSAKSRKKLSESVKHFKQQLKEQQNQASSTTSGDSSAASSSTNANTLKLMKSFQIEVDDLTKRAKSAESAFMSVYQHLFELPDVVPYLNACRYVQHKLIQTYCIMTAWISVDIVRCIC